VEKVKLELGFLDELNKKFRISIDDPKEDLDSIQIQGAMESLLTHDIFVSNGVGLAAIDGAKIIRTNIEEIEF
jgi:hypothetical protein